MSEFASRPSTPEFSSEDIRRILAENEQLRAENERLRRDPLTGLLNRAGLVAELGKWRETHAGDSRIAFAYIDLNNFKGINDAQGHEKGDYVLQIVSSILTNSLRTDDMISRWGGDEIVLALPIRRSAEETQDEDVFYALDDKLNGGLEEVIATMRDHDEPTDYLRKLGFAIGVKIYEARDVENGLESLLQDPDKRMYTHKKMLKRRQ